MTLATTSMTGYGLVGLDLVWQTICKTADGQFVSRRNGANTVLPTLSTVWYTGDAVRSALVAVGARHTLDTIAVPVKYVTGHVTGRRQSAPWTLDAFALKMGLTQHVVDLLKAHYADVMDVAA